MWISSDNISSDISLVVNIAFRLLILGGIIFLATTYIPATPPAPEIRLAIAVIVVVIYSLIDIIGSYLSKMKGKLCEWVCGTPSNVAYDTSYQTYPTYQTY